MPLLGTHDTIITLITLHLRISNLGRPKTTVERIDAKITPRMGFSPKTCCPTSVDGLAAHARIELTEPIDFGCPRTGWLQFYVEHSKEKDLVAGILVLTITDGIGQTSTLEYRT